MLKHKTFHWFPFLLVLYEMATYFSNDVYLPALPQMMSDLNLNLSTAQFSLTIWFIGGSITPFFVGAFSERFGRRPLLLIGGIIYILANLITALTSNTQLFMLARFIQGSMVPTMIIPGYALIHEYYEQKQAIKILALMGSISVLAPALGPLLGGIILSLSTWRTIFWFITIWSLISILLLIKWMPETLSIANREPLHLKKSALHYWHILTNKKFMQLMSVLGLLFAGFIAWITAGPLLVIDSLHYSPIAFGLIQALVFAIYILGTHCVKYLLEWISVRHLIQLGLSISFFGSMLIGLFSFVLPFSLLAFVMAMMCYSFGTSLCFSSLNRSIIESTAKPMGVRMAMFSIFLQIYAALGSGVSSLFFNSSIPSLGYLIMFAGLFSFSLYFFRI